MPGMDFGAESTAMVQGGEYCGTWLRVGGGWLGVGFGFFRDQCRRLASRGGGGVNVGRIVSGCCYSGYDHCTPTKFTITSLFMHRKCTEKLWWFIHSSEYHMVSCQIQKMVLSFSLKPFSPRASSKNVNIKMCESIACYRSV